MQRANYHGHTIWVDEDGALANSAEFTNLLTEKFHINMKTTGGYNSWLNGKDERTHQTIKNLVFAALLDSNHKMDKLFCASESAATVYNATLHSALNISPYEAFTGKKYNIHDLRVFGCDIYPFDHTKDDSSNPSKTHHGSFMGHTNHKLQIKWWDPKTNNIKLCISARFDEYNATYARDGWSPDSKALKGEEIKSLPVVTINTSTKPFLASEIKEFVVPLPPKNNKIGIDLNYCTYFNLTYISKCINGSSWYKHLPAAYRRNVFLLSINDHDIIHNEYAKTLFNNIKGETNHIVSK